MPELLDIELHEGTPLQEYSQDARSWVADARDVENGDGLHEAVAALNDLRTTANNMARGYDELVRIIQVLVMAEKATWHDVERAKKIARALR